MIDRLRGWDPEHLLRSLFLLFVVGPLVLALTIWLLFAFGSHASSKSNPDCPPGTFIENC